MRGSSQRILTTQAGSLPRPPDLIELDRARQQGAAEDEAGFQARLRDAVREVVARQRAAGIDVPGDGELGKAMGQPVDYGAWWTYSFERLRRPGVGADRLVTTSRRTGLRPATSC